MMTTAETIQRRPIIQIRDLKKTYRSLFRRERIQALRGISLDVYPGEIFGFLGPNGSGKTTTVKLILGLLHVYSGQITVFERSPRSIAIKKKIGYMPERAMLPTYLRLDEFLRLMGSLSGLRGRHLADAVEKTTADVGLGEVARSKLDTFSKGMLQRASLAQALISGPELLVLDEPDIGLDPLGRKQFRELLVALRNRGTTIFLNTHELEVAQMISDRFAILHKGEILGTEDISVLHHLGQYVVRLEHCPVKPETLLDKLGHDCQWDETRKTLVLTCPNVTELNRIIDTLRTLEIEIASITPFSISLEDFFLRYLKDKGVH